MLRHHFEHLRKIHQRDERRIESLLLSRVGQRRARQPGICLQPVIYIQNFLWICRGSGDLGKQGIRIERDRGQQLVQLLRGGWSSLRCEEGTEVRGNHERNQ